jgi:hypothetical protein
MTTVPNSGRAWLVSGLASDQFARFIADKLVLSLVRNFHLAAPLHYNGFQVLRSHHCAGIAARQGTLPVVRDRGDAAQILPGRGIIHAFKKLENRSILMHG